MNFLRIAVVAVIAAFSLVPMQLSDASARGIATRHKWAYLIPEEGGASSWLYQNKKEAYQPWVWQDQGYLDCPGRGGNCTYTLSRSVTKGWKIGGDFSGEFTLVKYISKNVFKVGYEQNYSRTFGTSYAWTILPGHSATAFIYKDGYHYGGWLLGAWKNTWKCPTQGKDYYCDYTWEGDHVWWDKYLAFDLFPTSGINLSYRW